MFVYDLIPNGFIKGKILEISAGNEEWSSEFPPQLKSKHRDKFVSKNYLGIDLEPPRNNLLGIIKQDVLTYDPDTTFDTILMIDVIEHIPFEKWKVVFGKINSWLNPGGYLILSTPYNEPYVSPHPWNHCVFEINEKMISTFLHNADIKIYSHPYLLGTEEENKIWAFFRHVKRRLKNHPFLKYKLVVFWQKN